MGRDNNLYRLFQSFIKEKKLIKKKDSLLIAYSGGADSTLLLYLLKKLQKEWELELNVLHFHHGLRSNSDAELKFCSTLCEKWGLAFYFEYLDVQSYSLKNQTSIEEAGRILRYQFLQEKLVELHGDSVVTAHHQDDLTETFLLHLFQGSGISGLASLKVRRNNIIRPLLFCNKSAILTFLQDKNISFVNDESNQESYFQRNYVRNNIIPTITQRFSVFSEKIQNLCAMIELEEEDWAERIRSLRKQVIISRDLVNVAGDLFKQHSVALMARFIRFLIQELMGREYFPSYYDIAQVLNMKKDMPGNKVALDKKGLHIDVSYGDVILYKKDKNFPLSEIYVKLMDSESILLPPYYVMWKQARTYVQDENGATLKYCEVMKIRSWKAGDRFKFCTDKTQKLQDYFVNNKIKSWQKQQSLIFLSESDEIMAFYIPERGWRVSFEFYVKKNEKSIYLNVSEG